MKNIFIGLCFLFVFFHFASQLSAVVVPCPCVVCRVYAGVRYLVYTSFL